MGVELGADWGEHGVEPAVVREPAIAKVAWGDLERCSTGRDVFGDVISVNGYPSRVHELGVDVMLVGEIHNCG